MGIGIIALGHGPGVRSKFAPSRAGSSWVCHMAALPHVHDILGDKSIDNFTKDEHGESIGFDSVLAALGCFVIPDGRNAFFDAETSPLWLWPLCVWGFVVLWQGLPMDALGLGSMVVTYMILYSGLPYSVVIWKMSRYHATMLPAVVLLTAVGMGCSGATQMDQEVDKRRLSAGVGISGRLRSMVSALFALPMDWQQDLHGAIELGQNHSSCGQEGAVVTPDVEDASSIKSPQLCLSAYTGATRGPHGHSCGLYSEVLAHGRGMDGDVLLRWSLCTSPSYLTKTLIRSAGPWSASSK